jgi:hypothetical protein
MKLTLYPLLTCLFLSSCFVKSESYNHKSPDHLNFENINYVDSLMQAQIKILKKLPVVEGRATTSWEMVGKDFILNGYNLEKNNNPKDSILSSWNLSTNEYRILKLNAEKLYSLDICGCMNGISNVYQFDYQCGLRTFDEYGRYIFLKQQLGEQEKRMVEYTYPTILDENEKMILRIP